MLNKEEKIIQIVSFTTNDTDQTPNDVLKILLEQYTHTLITESKHALEFNIVLPKSVETSKIMICSLLDLTREYDGITDVNCYMVFIELQNENSKKCFESIISYIKKYCDLKKEIYVLGMINKNNKSKEFISYGNIKKVMKSNKLNYEYIEINFVKTKIIADSLLKIFINLTKESKKKSEIKNKGQAHSCNVF